MSCCRKAYRHEQQRSSGHAPRQGRKRVVTIGRLKRIVGASLLIAFAASCGLKDKPIPTEPKARSDFLNAAAAKLTSEERNLLNRFVARLDAQTAAGGPAGDIPGPRALTR